MEYNFDEELRKLMDGIKNNRINSNDFKNLISLYQNLGFEIQKYLEYAAKNAKDEDKEKIWKLLEKFTMNNSGYMVDKLRELGYALKNEAKRDKAYENVITAVSDQAFRIMERVRHSQRSEVHYMLMRIFVANKKEFPPLLAYAFNPTYSNELFKTFIYSFLSGILGETKEGGAE